MAPLKASAVHIGYLNLDNVHMLLILKEHEMCYINECSPRILKSLCREVCCRRVPWWTFWYVMRGAVRKAKVRREDLVKTDICNSSWEKPQRTKSAGSWRAWSWANATGEKLPKSLGSHTPPESYPDARHGDFGCNVFIAGIWPDFELMLLAIHFKMGMLISCHCILEVCSFLFYFILQFKAETLDLKFWAMLD